MHIHQSEHASFIPSRLRESTLPMLAVAFISAALAARLCAAGSYGEAFAVAAAAIGAAFLVRVPISIEAVVIIWFATAPLVSFYVRIPTDRSIITYNRIVFAVLAVALSLKWMRITTAPATREQAIKSPAFSGGAAMWCASFAVSKFEIAWALLAVLTLASAMAYSDNVAYATRMAIDTFALPLLAFHVARNHLDLRGRGNFLVFAAVALALFLFATGAFEFATGTDLFAYKGSEIVREGERRVNGPFASDSSYAIICLLLFLFLRAAPGLFRLRLDRGARLVYLCALAGAALGALLPMFRAVAIALAAGWMVLWLTERRGRLRAQPSRPLQSTRVRGHLAPARRIRLNSLIVVILIALALVGFVAAMAPLLAGSRLADPRTAYGRLATWKSAAEIAVENPIFGVGLGNYPEYYDRVRHEEDEPIEEVLDTRASRDPHSNVLWIAAELGLPGIALYLAANVWLFLLGWRALKRAARGPQRAAAGCFLALVAGYWIPGLTLASGYYSDLNLCFFFLLGALSSPLFRQPHHPTPSVDFGD